jgi:hypothetical protein
MKKVLTLLFTGILISTFLTSSAQAGETGEPVGGFAVVNPETGIVHGVITGSIEYFGGNNRTMGSEYMGCPAGCLIIQQSTADQNGNVSGIRTEDNGNKTVTYIPNREVFQVVETDVVQSQTVTESASNAAAVETEVTVSRSQRVYEFGVQNFTNTGGQFQMTEISPAQNTSAQIGATTKEYACNDREMICSRTLSSSSKTIVEESVSFSERKTSEQVLAQAVAQARAKIQEQMSLILAMLGRWTLN